MIIKLKLKGGTLDREMIVDDSAPEFSSEVGIASVVANCGRENGVGGTFSFRRSRFRITRFAETPDQVEVDAELIEPA